jgi:hypothetical protein
MTNQKSKIRNPKSAAEKREGSRQRLSLRKRKRISRPPYIVRIWYVGNDKPLRFIFHSRNYARFIAARAKASPLCSKVTFNDSANIPMLIPMRHMKVKKYPPDMMKFLKEQLNEQIKIRNRNN